MSENAVAGWYPDADPSRVRYWDGIVWTEQRKPAVDTDPAAAPGVQAVRISGEESVQPPPGYGPRGGLRHRPAARPGLWRGPFLRFLGLYIVMAITIYILVGFVWWAIAMSQTGRRKRDLLMILIPIWGTIVLVQRVWRYTAKNVCWPARADRPSKSLFATA